MRQNILELKSVKKKFKNSKGLENISFRIQRGDFVGLIGNNGAGKTTTIKIILSEYKKDKGVILFDGTEINTSMLKKVGFFPDQNNYPKSFNIVEFAKYSASLKGIKKKEYINILDDLIESLELLEHKKDTFNELSSGMQKRALLLSVLITQPEILILDEPTANLDVQSRIDFFKILKYLNEEMGMTIIVTSHIIDELENSINYAIIIDKGRTAYDKSYDLKKDGKLKDVYQNVLENPELTNHDNGSSIKFNHIKNILANKEIKRDDE